LTVPVNVAPDWPTFVAEPVDAVGGVVGAGGVPVVVNVWSAPTDIPASLMAMIRK
jgi:hypothetical protein